MFREIRRCHLTTVSFAAACLHGGAYAASVPANPTIERSDYVRLEVTLDTNSTDKKIVFRTACPKKNLFDVDLKTLLSGSDHVTLGVTISTPAPTLGTVEFTPVSIDKVRTGIFGSTCDVMIDEMRYLSPAFYVRSYENQQFTVSPSYNETTAINPGLAKAIDAAASLALNISSVPAASAAPYQAQLQALLGPISVAAKEGFPKHPVIAVGNVPADLEWGTQGLLKPKHGALIDVTLKARLVPVATLIPDPPPAAGGAITWQPVDVLQSPFATNLNPAVPIGTFGSYMAVAEGPDIANYKAAASAATAEAACSPIWAKIQTMGLSDRDAALLMWAVTHDLPPAAVPPGERDNLPCLTAVWNFAPAEVKATRVPVVIPPPPGSPPTKKQMQATTQINDAFAIFFKTTLWAERKSLGSSLFKYPGLKYTDSKGLLFQSSAVLENVDQWLALHVDATPVVSRVGCYTYLPASDPKQESLMLAIADLQPGRSAAEAVLIATFANVSGNDDAKIESLEVTDTLSPDQKSKILLAQGSQCSSGYKPPIVFGS